MKNFYSYKLNKYVNQCVYIQFRCVCMREHTINTVNRLLDNTMNHRYEQLWVQCTQCVHSGRADALLICWCVRRRRVASQGWGPSLQRNGSLLRVGIRLCCPGDSYHWRGCVCTGEEETKKIQEKLGSEHIKEA